MGQCDVLFQNPFLREVTGRKPDKLRFGLQIGSASMSEIHTESHKILFL